ncbi:ankyrin repeat-containing protein BDA1-like [Punica granatum]|uniref:PGG domain-containing protein n=2 Tax=Punica granatum TaxID=22663 RepID=A0A218WQJ4_PUNGR|nr:ankyrin repeat-containing protein BDA1-like [Punica granatum]OWM75124.1 hypothetical protein CDL15_Pgr017250 [Punica granatum]PKI55656.1 hypothetical protein CRG98_023967 [Punica granatum]
MDARLFEAARTGDVNYLHSLCRDVPLILEAAALQGGETPLHVSVVAGHLDFACELLKLRPAFAEEMNPDGLAPLHIASAKGSLEIVRELLKLGPQLCLLKGRERRIPLHYSAIKGRVQVMKELLSACGSSIEEVTARGETALHLAVKNSQFEALTVLVDQLKKTNKESLLNCKDSQGDTILHLAVGTKQYEVVDLLLNGKIVHKDRVDVNAVNQRGLTPLDILSIVPSESGDREIRHILTGADAPSIRVVSESQDDHCAAADGLDNRQQARCSRWGRIFRVNYEKNQWLDYLRFKKGRDSANDARSTLLVVATLITTATYQAVLQPPGGLWQDDSDSLSGTADNSSTLNGIAPKTHKAGKAVLGNLNPGSYITFLLFNSLGFFASIQMIICLTMGFPLHTELMTALWALVITYDTSMGAMTPNSFFNCFFVALSAALPVLMGIITLRARR